MKSFSTFILVFCALSMVFVQPSFARLDFGKEQANAVETVVIDMFNEDMAPIASRSGWTLEEDQTRFSFDEEIYVGLVPIAALIIGSGWGLGGLLTAKTGAAIVAFLSTGVGGAIGAFVGAHSSGMGVVSALATAGVIVGGGLKKAADLIDSLTIITPSAVIDCFKGSKIRCAVYMPANDHYKLQVHYEIRDANNRKESGNCDYFFQLNLEGLEYKPRHEVDSCTHENIFTQEQLGYLRIGNKAGIFDRGWGQDLVVIGIDEDGDIIE